MNVDVISECADLTLPFIIEFSYLLASGVHEMLWVLCDSHSWSFVLFRFLVCRRPINTEKKLHSKFIPCAWILVLTFYRLHWNWRWLYLFFYWTCTHAYAHGFINKAVCTHRNQPAVFKAVCVYIVQKYICIYELLNSSCDTAFYCHFIFFLFCFLV